MSKHSVDLDALAPEAGEVTIGGQKYVVNPPTTGQLIKIVSIFQSFQEAINSKNSDEADVKAGELSVLLKEMVPEIADKDLSFGQIVALSNMVSEMAMPTQLEELNKNGVTVESVKKNLAG